MKTLGLTLMLIALCVALAPAADWELANHGLVGYTVADVVIDPNNPSVLYCSCKDGVYKSVNAGLSWSKSSAGLAATPSAGQLHIDPSDSSRIYVVASDSSGSYVWRTDNAASTWQKKGSGITLPYIASVEVCQSNPAVVLCGTIIGGRDGGCFRSADRGDSWTQIAGSNIAGSGLGNDCSPLVADPVDPNRLYCGRTYYSDFLRSTDGGHHWTWNGETFDVRAILVDPVATNRVIAAGRNHLKLSTDYGQTFTSKIAGQQFQALAFAPGKPDVIYATTTSNGIYRSVDAGVTWSQVPGSELHGFGRISVHPADPDTIYCVSPGRGVAKSTDGGHTFTFINNGLPTDLRVMYMAEQPGGGATYALVSYVGLYRTFDQGASWQFLSSIPYFPKGLAFDPKNPSTLYCIGFPSDQVFRSTDGGFNWSPLPSAPTDDYYTAIAVDPSNPNKLFIAGSPSNKVYRTANSGQTWEAVLTVTPMPDWWSTSIWSISIDPTNPNRVYVSTYSHPWRSVDGGTTWTALTNLHYPVLYGDPGTWHDTSSVRHIAIDPDSPNVLYACTQWGGTWKSVDYGDTWTRVFGDHLYTTNNVLVDSRDHNTLWMTSLGGYGGVQRGVLKSVDAGASWTGVSSGLLGNDTYPNLVHQSASNPDRFYVGASANGVYRSPGGGWGLSIDEARALPDNAYCLLAEEPIVSIKYSDGSGCVQNADRLNGIRVTNLGGFVEGDVLRLTGTLRADGPDRYMQIDTAATVGRVDAPRPLSLGSRALNDPVAPSGIYSRVWGNVSYASPDGLYYYVDDGGGAVDGTGRAGTKVRCLGAPSLAQDAFAVVEGALGLSSQDGRTVPCLIVRGMRSVIQGTVSNYLLNPGFESEAFEPWSVVGTGVQHVAGTWYFGISARSGVRFVGVYGNWAAYSGCVVQVAEVVPGGTYHASVWSRVYHGGNAEDSAMSRIGIDPTGATDPAAATVRWSAWDTQPTWYYSAWKQISTPSVVVSGDRCAVFLQYAQQDPSYYHINCFDDACITRD